MVEVPPFLMNDLNRVLEERITVDGDLLKVFGFDRLEGHGDPLNVWFSALKLHIFEFRGPGEIKQRYLRRVYVRKQSGNDQPQKLKKTYPGWNRKR